MFTFAHIEFEHPVVPMTHILLIYSCLHKSLQYALNQTYLNTIISLFPVQLTHLIILTQYKALSSYILTTYPKFLNPIKIFLFLFQEKHIRFMKQFPQQTRSPLERVSPESPWAYLSIIFAYILLQGVHG